MNSTQQTDRAEALIAKIQKDAREEAGKILAESKEKAEEIAQKARQKARLKVRDVIQKIRARDEREMTRETARFETEQRQWRQRDERRALAEGLAHLEPAMNDLWAMKSSREEWCRNVLSVAAERLPAEGWRLEHPSDFPKDELSQLAHEIEAHTGAAPECLQNDSLLGVRIYAGTACVDGSIEAMLADEQNTSAKFLSIFLAMNEEGAP